MTTLDGPRTGLVPGAAKQLVVLLHGYGANGEDLLGLGEAWRGLLPEAAFVAPNAPEGLPGPSMHGSYQWFPITLRDPSEFRRGVLAAAPLLDRFLDAEHTRYRLDESRLALVGFSQGTMMALHVGLRRSRPPVAIIGYSGRIAAADLLPAELKVRPPVLLVHGDQDELIPVAALHDTREILAKTGLSVEWHVSRGLGHGIDEQGLAIGGRFLAARFKENR
jgi:phospholipase/carboxylesterase